MKKELHYREAFAALEVLVAQLEEGDIDLEELAAKIKQANELIETCTRKLRKVEEETSAAMLAPAKSRKK